MSSPERSNTIGSSTGRYSGVSYSTGNSYEEPYYSQYSGTVTPIIDEEARYDTVCYYYYANQDCYSL